MLWLCSIEADDSESTYRLSISQQPNADVAAALARLRAGLATAADERIGVELVINSDSWEVITATTYVPSADGAKSIRYQITGDGPVILPDAPFALAFPRFPLVQIATTNSLSFGSVPSEAIAAPASKIHDASTIGRTKLHAFGDLYPMSQVIDSSATNAVLRSAASAAADRWAGALGLELDSGCEVTLSNGSTVVEQYWVEGAPWAVVEQAPGVKTTLIEYHKGTTP
jgi:hypothetical protein